MVIVHGKHFYPKQPTVDLFSIGSMSLASEVGVRASCSERPTGRLQTLGIEPGNSRQRDYGAMRNVFILELKITFIKLPLK